METCSHERCNCAVDKGKTYCSEFCETATADEVCACGHPDCADYEAATYGENSAFPNEEDQRDMHAG